MINTVTNKAVAKAEAAYADAMVGLPHHECKTCGGSGAVITMAAEVGPGGSPCPDCDGVGSIVDFPEGWNPMRAALTAALPHLGSGEAVPVAWRVRARSGDGPQRPVKEWQIFKTETAALKAIRLFPLTGEIEPLYLHPAPPSSGLMEEVKALRQIISECAEACGAGIAPTASIEFMAKLPDEIRLSAKLKDATP